MDPPEKGNQWEELTGAPNLTGENVIDKLRDEIIKTVGQYQD